MRSFPVVILFALTIAACSSEPKAPAPTPAAKKQNDTISRTFTFVNPNDSVPVNGEYIQRHKNGVIELRGMMKDGQREGVWKSWYEDGSPWSETTFRGGKKNGRTVTWYDNEQMRYEGTFRDDKETGKWKFYTEQGKLSTEQDFGQ